MPLYGHSMPVLMGTKLTNFQLQPNTLCDRARHNLSTASPGQPCSQDPDCRGILSVMWWMSGPSPLSHTHACPTRLALNTQLIVLSVLPIYLARKGIGHKGRISAADSKTKETFLFRITNVFVFQQRTMLLQCFVFFNQVNYFIAFSFSTLPDWVLVLEYWRSSGPFTFLVTFSLPSKENHCPRFSKSPGRQNMSGANSS